MDIQLSDHFNTGRLVKFVLPSIAMMVFTSIYGVVDGFFVSNYAGDMPFAGLNLIMPVIMMLGSVGFMLGAGGTALVSKTLGEGKEKLANELFSLLVYTVIAFGIVACIVCQIFLPQIARLLGATDAIITYAVQYGRIALLSLTFFMLQNMFQSFLITAEKPKLGLYITIGAGVANMVLDLVFVGIMKGGVIGAAAATAVAEFIGGFVPLVYFVFAKNSKLRLGKTRFYGWALVKASTNGVSELLSNISMSLMSMLFNLQLLKYFGENGVSAYGVLMYVGFVFVAIYIGYSIGVAPIVGFNYGAQNVPELQNILYKSMRFIALTAVLMFVLAFGFARPITGIFVSKYPELWDLTATAFRMYATCYLLNGFNIYGSSFFTALNNGKISAIISTVRTLIFQLICIYALPALFGANAIWLSVTVSEVMAVLLTFTMLLTQNKHYGYLKKRGTK